MNHADYEEQKQERELNWLQKNDHITVHLFQVKSISKTIQNKLKCLGCDIFYRALTAGF